MIDLNFVPDHDQKAIARYAMSIVARHLAIWFVFAIVVVALLLAWGKFFLERNLAIWEEQSILVAQRRASVSERIRLLNQTAIAVSKVQEEYRPWSELLMEFASIVPPGNRVDSLLIDNRTGMVEIRGFSTTRENVLAFEKALNDNPFFTEVKSPLTNLLNPKNIDFSFTAKLSFGDYESRDENL